MLNEIEEKSMKLGKLSILISILGIVIPISIGFFILRFIQGDTTDYEMLSIFMFLGFETIALILGLHSRDTRIGKAGLWSAVSLLGVFILIGLTLILLGSI